MTYPGHSGDDLLLRHAAGALDAGFSLLVETHLAISGPARRLYAQFEALGGAMLEEMTPAHVDAAALNRALAAIEDDTPDMSGDDRRALTRRTGLDLPAPLAAADIHRWRWIAPGVRSSRIGLPVNCVSRAFLLEIAPGVTVPRHGHEGDEATCVLSGGFRDGGAHFGPGDIAQVDERIAHDIVVDSDTPCLCLIAMEGRTRPSSWFGRLYQKFRDI